MTRRDAFEFLADYCEQQKGIATHPDDVTIWTACAELMEAEKDFHLNLFDARKKKE